MFAYLVDYKMSAILIRNDFNSSIQILKKLKLGYIQELDYDHCFYAENYVLG